MANICDVEMKVKGNRESILKFLDILKEIPGLPYESDLDYWWENDNVLRLNSGCRWSMGSCLSAGNIDFQDVSKKLNLLIEYFTVECGCNFSESYKVDCGELIDDRVFDYFECLPSEMEYSEFLEWADFSSYEGKTDRKSFLILQDKDDFICSTDNLLDFSF